MMRKPPSFSIEKAAYVATAIVALVAAVISFAHMQEVGYAAGEEWRSWLLPLSVDGQLTSATLVAWHARRKGKDIPKLTVLSLSLGLAASVGANVAAPLLPEGLPVGAEGVPPLPEDVEEEWKWLPVVVGAWPPVALALAFESVLRLREFADDGRAADQQVSAESADVPEVVSAESVDVPVASAGPVDVPEVASGDVPPASAEPADVPPLPEAVSADVPDASAEPVDVPEAETEELPVVIPTSSISVPVDGDVRTRAKERVRQVLAEGGKISGAQVGSLFGKTDRWGRSIIAEVRNEMDAPVNGAKVL